VNLYPLRTKESWKAARTHISLAHGLLVRFERLQEYKCVGC
jgi:hypothetical protein